MYSKPLSAASTWVALLALTNASPLAQVKSGKYTLFKEAPLAARDDASFFPFPGNQSSIVDEASSPPDLPGQDYTISEETVSTNGEIPRAFIETKCDADKKAKITSAWADANILAKAQTTFRIGYNYDIPHTQWLGKNWNDESSWIPWRYDYRKFIGDNFGRLAKLFSNEAPKHEFVYWYCYDYSNLCDLGTYAYSWDSLGLFWSNHYVVFCPVFYDRRSLAETVTQYEGDKHQQKVMENFDLNRGQIMLHEVYHFKDLVSQPRTDDKATRAQGNWELARDKGTAEAYINADSYALDAVAIYVQQYYKSAMSPVPFRELGKYDAEAAAAVSQPEEADIRSMSFEGVPPNWTGLVSDTDSPDPADWEEVDLSNPTGPPLSGAGPVGSTPECDGVETTKWMGRDALNNVISTYCAEAEAQGVQDQDSGSLQRNYNEGTNDAVSLSMDWLSGSSFKPNKDECVKYMSTIMDGCDGNDPDNNPLNWKHGGSNQVGDVKYNVNPLTERYKSGVCGMHIKEAQHWYGFDTPGFQRHHFFWITLDAKDSENKSIGGSNGEPVEAGQDGGNPYIFDGYYNRLEITPQARGDYVGFTIGDQHWTSDQHDGTQRCTVGDWDSDTAPRARDMDCFFLC